MTDEEQENDVTAAYMFSAYSDADIFSRTVEDARTHAMNGDMAQALVSRERAVELQANAEFSAHDALRRLRVVRAARRADRAEEE